MIKVGEIHATPEGNMIVDEITSANVAKALTYAEMILSRSPDITTNDSGRGPIVTTRSALDAVRSALAQSGVGAVLQVETQDRKTFSVPDGFEAVRDAEGRATGAVRPIGVGNWYDQADEGFTPDDVVQALHEAVREPSPLPAAQEAPGTEWPEPTVKNPDIANETGVAYIDSLIHQLLDAQQDINLAANEHMDQSLCNASVLIDEVEAALLKFAALQPAPAQGALLRQAMRKAMDIYQADDSDDVPADMFMALHAALATPVAPQSDGVEIETQAWNCNQWPSWLHGLIAKTNEVADRLDMSSEQASAYAVLSALRASQQAADEKGGE
jgi:hypothetical protein